MSESPVIVVGAGLAGMLTTLKLAPHPVLLLTPSPIGEGAASAWAQGGVASALGDGDSPEQHAADTVAAGAGLVDAAVAGLVAAEGPARVRELLALGVPFDLDAAGRFVLSLEAAHGRARVARVKGDLAGHAIIETLLTAMQGTTHVTRVEGASLESLLQDTNGAVTGVVCRQKHELRTFYGPVVVLATGGVGGLYGVTTNPDMAQGVALAAAWRAGALLRDVEFVQFHPTALDVPIRPAPLVTEALRGHGATLVNADGRRFMAQYHPSAEMAPRDVVARAIHAERLAGRGTFLDAREAVGEGFPGIFPTVFAACQAAGIDPRSQPVPVAPAAHYHMGGIVTDAVGRTTLPGLYAVGECASTGLHGANRLASNSLLEAMVFAHRTAEHLRGCLPSTSAMTADGIPERPDPVPLHTLLDLRERMTRDAGLVREASGLRDLLEHLERLVATHGMANPLVSSRLIVEAALAREESRGSHFRSDFPAPAAVARHSFTVAERPA